MAIHHVDYYIFYLVFTSYLQAQSVLWSPGEDVAMWDYILRSATWLDYCCWPPHCTATPTHRAAAAAAEVLLARVLQWGLHVTGHHRCHVSRSCRVCADQLELELELVLAHWWTPGSWQPPGAGPGLVTSTTTTAGGWRGEYSR